MMSADTSIIHPGSSGIVFTNRESQVGQLLSMAWAHKKIGNRLGISTANVSVHVRRMALRIPGDGKPSQKVVAWWQEHR